MADCAYPAPIHDHPPVDGERLKREFQQRQAERCKAIRAELKRRREAAKRGEKPDPRPLW